MPQIIIQGIDKLPQILKKIGSKKIFIVTGFHSYSSLNFKELIDSLDIEKVFFTEFTSNPLYEQVCKGIDLFEAQRCDGILAIGGGSPMDVAKCIKVAVLAEEGKTAIIPPLVNTRINIDGTKIPFIAIPTTAGTGSESTHNAVMYYEGIKQTITNDSILPDYAILEPSVLRTLPLYQKKCTMMDALCQGIESWWSVNSTVESHEYSRKAIELIMQNWERYIFENDEEAAANIMLGANYSGKAISIAQTTAAHAMSYKITSLYGLPHGHAVSLCFSVIWEYMIGNMDRCVEKRGKDYLSNVFQQIAHAMGANTPTEAISLFQKLMKLMKLEKPVSNNKELDMQILASSVNPTRLKNNPIELLDNIILNMYNAILTYY